MSEFEVFRLNFFNYGKPFFGSYKAMRYGIRKVTEEDEEGNKSHFLECSTWKGPFSNDKTPDEEKTFLRFSFDEEGREDLLAWLKEEYEAKYNG